VATPEEILSEHTAPVRELAGELRTMVRGAIPDAEERAYPGWHAIGYRDPDAGYVAGIFPAAGSVALLFEHGHALPDPDGLLEAGGSRTQVRTITLRPGEAIPEAGVRRLLEAAVAFGLRRRAR
jgi:hypothetical protein